MAKFSSKSRYVKHSSVYQTTDRRGREVQALTPAEIPDQRELGEHLRKDHQRLDHLASHYLDDPTGYWRIAKHNDAMAPDVISQSRIIKIPTKR
ncbi:MAG: hypothetical protein AAF412_14320 [Pseudomonadota bacterium]